MPHTLLEWFGLLMGLAFFGMLILWPRPARKAWLMKQFSAPQPDDDDYDALWLQLYDITESGMEEFVEMNVTESLETMLGKLGNIEAFAEKLRNLLDAEEVIATGYSFETYDICLSFRNVEARQMAITKLLSWKRFCNIENE